MKITPRLLSPDEFPVTLATRDAKTDETLWAVTLLKPPPGYLTPLYIPPIAQWTENDTIVSVDFANGTHREHTVPRPGPQG